MASNWPEWFIGLRRASVRGGSVRRFDLVPIRRMMFLERIFRGYSLLSINNVAVFIWWINRMPPPVGATVACVHRMLLLTKAIELTAGCRAGGA
jgi:hypothetical protein